MVITYYGLLLYPLLYYLRLRVAKNARFFFLSVYVLSIIEIYTNGTSITPILLFSNVNAIKTRSRRDILT
jgi:hypothetical protein